MVGGRPTDTFECLIYCAVCCFLSLLFCVLAQDTIGLCQRNRAATMAAAAPLDTELLCCRQPVSNNASHFVATHFKQNTQSLSQHKTIQLQSIPRVWGKKKPTAFFYTQHCVSQLNLVLVEPEMWCNAVAVTSFRNGSIFLLERNKTSSI